MQAVFISGGKQHRVTKGQTLKLEKLPNEAGDTIAFDQVLLLADGDNITLGAPVIKGASISAEVISQGRHKKINIIKMRRRKHYMRRQGHRQDYTEVRITDINGG